jgi:hypothetical protein
MMDAGLRRHDAVQSDKVFVRETTMVIVAITDIKEHKTQ